MSISEGLNAGGFGAEISSNQFGTDGRSFQLDETLLEENNVDKVLGTSLVLGLNFEANEATSKIVDDGAPGIRSRLAEIEPEKKKSKPTEHWQAYQTSQSEDRRMTLHSRLLRKSSAVDELLYSVRNVEAVRKQMLQIDDVFKILIEVHREYNSLLPLEMQEQDEDWFDDIDEKMMSFKNRIHNLIRDVEHERKEQLSSKSRYVTSKHSSRRKSSSSSFPSRSSKDKRALQEKLRMAELLAEAEFLKKRQSAKIQEEKLKTEENIVIPRQR